MPRPTTPLSVTLRRLAVPCASGCRWSDPDSLQSGESGSRRDLTDAVGIGGAAAMTGRWYGRAIGPFRIAAMDHFMSIPSDLRSPWLNRYRTPVVASIARCGLIPQVRLCPYRLMRPMVCRLRGIDRSEEQRLTLVTARGLAQCGCLYSAVRQSPVRAARRRRPAETIRYPWPRAPVRTLGNPPEGGCGLLWLPPSISIGRRIAGRPLRAAQVQTRHCRPAQTQGCPEQPYWRLTD